MRHLMPLSVLILAVGGCGGTTPTNDGMSYRSSMAENSGVDRGVMKDLEARGARLLKVAGKPMFVAGVVASSLDGSLAHDLGKNPFSPDKPAAYTDEKADLALELLSKIGVKTIKLTLFDGGEGLVVDAAGLVTGLDPDFVKNLQALAARARAKKLTLYFALSDRWKDLALRNPLLDEDARRAYLEHAVTPVTRLLKESDAVLAIDIHSGIEKELAIKEGEPGATWDQVRAFITAVREAIKKEDPTALVTCSSDAGQTSLSAGKFKDLGLDYYEIEVRHDDGEVPEVPGEIDLPVILRAGGRVENAWNDEKQVAAVSAFVTNALAKRYAGVLVGNLGHKGSEDPNSLIAKDGALRPAAAAIAGLLQPKPAAAKK